MNVSANLQKILENVRIHKKDGRCNMKGGGKDKRVTVAIQLETAVKVIKWLANLFKRRKK